MKAFIVLILNILFVASYSAMLHFGKELSTIDRKIWFNSTIGIYVVSILCISLSKRISVLCKEFLKIATFTIAATYGLIVINQFNLLANATQQVLTFLGIVFAFMTIVLISAYRHGLFKND